MTDLITILRTDFEKNHQGREYDFDETVRRFAKYVEAKKCMFVQGRAIVIFSPVDTGTVEFHCFNGGTGRDLSAAVIQFLTDMAGAYETAVTYYDNPRVSELMRFAPCHVAVQKIDEGADRTYEARFNLRSKAWVQ